MLKRLDLHSVGIMNLKYVTLSERSYNTHLPLVNEYICARFAAGEVTDPKIVRDILDSLFAFQVERFKQIVDQNKNLGFLYFVHNIHESWVVIRYQKDFKNPDIKKHFTNNEINDIAATGRVLRIVIEGILEEKFKDSITDSFLNNCTDDPSYVHVLEDLLFLGIQLMNLKELVNRLNRFEKSLTISISQEGRVMYNMYVPYHGVFNLLNRLVTSYDTNTYDVVNDSLNNCLMGVFGNNLKVFLNTLNTDSAFYEKEDFIENVIHVLGREKADPFYAGLTLTSRNKLSIKDSFINMQDVNRFTYRPILEFVDGSNNVCWLLGHWAAYESVRQLYSFGLLWKRLPSEWKSQSGLQPLLDWVDDNREKIMMSILVDSLKENKVNYDVNLRYLMGKKGQSVTIKEKPGEIDLLFLDDKNKIIYVCECKNSLPRTEMFYWLNEYKQIEEKFEIKLAKKLDWIKKNKQLVKNHFMEKFKLNIDLLEWRVEAMFIFMTPSLYMYDALFKTLSTVDFIKFLKNSFVYEYPDLDAELADGTPYKIPYPYLKSLDLLIEKGIL
jgi:hypothetical protein